MFWRSRLLALALAAVCMAGCGSPSAAPPTAAVGHYELVDNLCEHVSLDAITAVLPYVMEQMRPAPVTTDSVACGGLVVRSDDPGERGTVTAMLEVFASDSEAEERFNTYRDVNMRMRSAAEITRIGERALQFVDSTGNPVVRVLDGNAVISIDWTAYTTADVDLPDGIFEALTETIRATMASLQSVS